MEKKKTKGKISHVGTKECKEHEIGLEFEITKYNFLFTRRELWCTGKATPHLLRLI